jgi:hypothetical protein
VSQDFKGVSRNKDCLNGNSIQNGGLSKNADSSGLRLLSFLERRKNDGPGFMTRVKLSILVLQAMGTSARLVGETITVFCDKRCSEDDLRAVREELDSFLDGRPSARYTDSFNRAPSGSEESSLESPQQPQRRDLREEVAREMLLEAESESAEAGAADDINDGQRGFSNRRISDQQVKYELVPALPKGALVEVVVSCKL